jgi:hypothetical protein
MNKQLNYKNVIDMYVQKFGKEPEITGGSYFEPNGIIGGLIDAIDSGIEFQDESVPDGALI